MSAPRLNSRVYFARCFVENGIDMRVVKIGCSSDLDQRVAGLCAGLPFRCDAVASIPGDMVMEKFLHYWFRDDRIRGEYFHASEAVEEVISHVSQHGRLPMPLHIWQGEERWFSELDLVEYMDRNSIKISDVEKSLDGTFPHYQKLLERSRCGNRNILAAVMVTAVRNGINVQWPRDFNFIAAPATDASEAA